MIGILPTVRPEHLTEDTCQREPALRPAQRADLRGPRRGHRSWPSTASSGSSTYADTIAPEAACTSVQLHLQVNPETFAAHWNASQAIAGVQLALGANSPFFFGKELWRETRIALFEQATDTRSDELKAQGVRPRVWFGERWITSIFDLFEENVRYFPSLLPICDDEDPVEVLDRGDVPQLGELRLHNGTIYRWNRPVYDVVRGRPHLRVENRCLPAGPTVVDVLANAALLLRPGQGARRGRPAGVVADVVRRGRGELPQRRPARHRRARSTGRASARCRRPSWCCATCCRWRTGASRSGASTTADTRPAARHHRGRCLTGRNGASWQAATFHRLFDDHDRPDALREMMRGYVEHMHSNEPVHTWPAR